MTKRGRIEFGGRSALDLTGARVGRLVAVRPVAVRATYVVWSCDCDCGKTANVPASCLTRARPTRSCGCLREEASVRRLTRHGMTESATHRSWEAMRTRCANENRDNFARYGGSGITVCERWQNSFEAFFADMGSRPPRTSLDRIDPTRGYEPGNCRWATAREQANNKTDNVCVTVDGRTQTVAEWARELGIAPYTLYGRLKRGDSPSAAIRPVAPPKEITHNGMRATVREWSSRTGVAVRVINKRLARGLPPEAALRSA